MGYWWMASFCSPDALGTKETWGTVGMGILRVKITSLVLRGGSWASQGHQTDLD